MQELALLISGFLPGALHVLLGADHLAALAPLSVEAGHKAWRVGFRWGIGHALGILCVGLLAYSIGDWLDVAWLSDLGQPLVGLVLIGIGLWGFLHLWVSPSHFDVTSGSVTARGSERHVHTRAAFLVGAIHGVAGTGSVLGVVPALAQETWAHAAAFLVGFGVGTLAAMIGFASLLGVARPRGRRATGATYRWIFVLASSVCLAVGVLWILLPVFGIETHGG